MTEDLYQFADWILTNQALLVQYAINIVVSIAIFIVGTMVARAVSRTVASMQQSPIFSQPWCVTVSSRLP